jgi:uncharacterized protein with HEPN domain
MRDFERDNRNYLNDVLERLQRIRSFAQVGRSAFFESVMIQDAIICNLGIMGEATKRLTAELRLQYPQVSWQEIAGFRDVLIHNYTDVRLDAVWIVIEDSLPVLEAQLFGILQELASETAR